MGINEAQVKRGAIPFLTEPVTGKLMGYQLENGSTENIVTATTSLGGGVALSAGAAVPAQMLGSVLYAQRQHPGYLRADGAVHLRSKYPGLSETVGTVLDGLSVWASSTVANQQWVSVAWSPKLELYCAVSASGTSRIMTSPDGVVWTLVAAPVVASWASVAWSESLEMWCAVASSGAAERIMTSPDGVVWTPRGGVTAAGFAKVAWVEDLGRWFAVSRSGSAGLGIVTSETGVDWSPEAAPEAEWRGIAWSKTQGVLCAVASWTANRVMTRRRGGGWVASSMPDGTGTAWKDIAWSEKLDIFCAVGASSPQIAYSRDGKVWHTANVPVTAQWSSIIWVPGADVWCVMAASGDAVVITSPDAIKWTVQTPAASSGGSAWQTTAWSPALEKLVALSSNGYPINCMACSPAITYPLSTSFKIPTIPPAGTVDAFIYAGG